ncbi:MAG TPA: CbiX/SirB N-terminal domain-containing protein [Pseudomonadales bacterium]|nr:CbiX/SirB N-terminal domain-containing protein [Pseudomonadales bacterium]
MHALLVIAHGSRRAASNQEVMDLAQRLAEKLEGKYQHIAAGFLEMAEPDIAQTMQACIDAGATHIDVLPYFLSAGRHVVTDVPEDVHKVAAQYPHITVNILPYVGSVPSMLDLMAGICLQA